MRHYHYGRQLVDGDDIQQVAESLASDFLSQGPFLEAFEEAVARYCGARHCLAVCNGTAALHLACLGLGLGPGDAGWTSPLSFVASANAVRYCGARPGFVDVDPQTMNMDPDLLERALERAQQEGALPRVILPVHFAGLSCRMRRIRELADHYGVRVVEDACHALGARYRGEPVGSCRWSDVAVFSLHPVKSITSGEGGLILTNDTRLYEAMRTMRGHGLAKGVALGPGTPPYHAEMVAEGFNYKICEMQCALGLSQFSKLDRYVARRRALAGRYRERLALADGLALQETGDQGFAESAWHLLLALPDLDARGLTKAAFHERLAARGIHLMVHYYPIHLHTLYRGLGFGPGMYPHAEAYYERAFSLPLHPGLELKDVDHVCDEILAALD
jgi:UDP-4-amino-4,6-dideoxy-N-acetyl-beta-L-altrosamine transaminase